MSSNLLPELNLRAWQLGEHLRDHADELQIVEHETAGATVFDFAVDRTGSIAGGISLSMICMADLADIQLTTPVSDELGLPRVEIATDHPVASCIAAQYAGWPFSCEKYFAICSGPARMAYGEEDLIKEYGLTLDAEQVVGIFEANQLPDEAGIKKFAACCRVEPEQVMICVARTASLPGSIQVVARSIETTMHKLHELKFDLKKVKNATGTAPLPPIGNDDFQSLGWTNDSILYGSLVNIWLDAEDAEIESLSAKLPSSTSDVYGKPFLEIFEAFDRDFYKIDKMLFSPAQVIIHSLKSGRVFRCGQIRNDILRSSFRI